MVEHYTDSGPEASITLPSKLRIRQRLGMVSTSKDFKKTVVPPISALGGQTISAASFLTNLRNSYSEQGTTFTELPERAVRQVPKIVAKLIDDPGTRRAALSYWEDMSREDAQRPPIPYDDYEVSSGPGGRVVESDDGYTWTSDSVLG